MFMGAIFFSGKVHGSVFHHESDLDGHLPVLHFSFFEVPAGFNHLKPGQIFDGFMSPADGLGHGILHGFSGSAGEFNQFVNVFIHIRLGLVAPPTLAAFGSFKSNLPLPPVHLPSVAPSPLEELKRGVLGVGHGKVYCVS
jgi:hypothetical protein